MQATLRGKGYEAGHVESLTGMLLGGPKPELDDQSRCLVARLAGRPEREETDMSDMAVSSTC